MDITLLTTFLVPFLPFLSNLGAKAAEEAAKKFGEESWERAKAIWSKLEPKVEVKAEAKMAASQVAAKPENKNWQLVLQDELETLLKEHPDLAAAIAQIMKSDSPAASSVTNIEVQGQNILTAGDNSTLTGQIVGNEKVDFGSITIEKDAISSAIISGNGNRVVIYQYQQVERSVVEDQSTKPGEIGPNPYKGLLAFQETDGKYFFGREKQIKQLWNQLLNLQEGESAIRLLPIYGPSGSGKSSLARAGLIPELARRPLPGRTQARVAVLMPGTHPLEALASVLARVATDDPTRVAKTREFVEELERVSKGGEYEGLRRIADALPKIAVSPLIVLVDQFEEVYSLCENPADRNVFISNLLTAASDRSCHILVVMTLRSDFLGEIQKHLVLNRLFSEQGFLVPAMDEEELRQAICQPAKLASHPLDKATVELLIKETHGHEGTLPLLQFAL
ncbi:MAG TPA: ATP-binding protein, partial [Coleofasciculaceae cyanobacterium]